MISILLFIGAFANDLGMYNNNEVKNIELHQIVNDAIDAYDYKVYEINIENPQNLINKSLIVALLPSIGDPKVAVDCDNQPKLFDYYEWQTSYWYMQQLSVSYQERQSLNCSDSRFFIGVSAEVVSGYQLIAYLQNGIQILEFNIPLSGELVPNEILTFKLVPTQVNEKITLQIQANQANTFLKQCSGECNITQNDYNGNDTDTGVHLHQQSITFLHKDCLDCYYMIGLQSDSKQPYRILAKHNESHNQLREGQTDQYHVDEGFYVYYQYIVPNDTNIKSVKFQLTPYNGSCIMYGSSNNEYPNENDTNTLHQIQIYGAQKYYLSVYGQSECVFGIYTQVERYQTINQTYFITLQSGIPQKYLQSELYSFFQIHILTKQNLTINLQNNNGNFMMFVKSDILNKEIPDSNSYQWKDSKQIQININDPNYSTTFYLSVLKLDIQSQSEFIIQYTLSGDVEYHQVGEQIIGSVSKNQYHYYKLPLQQRDLMIFKDVYSNNDVTDLILYISFKNQHPDRFANFVMIGQNLTIPANEIQCQQKLSQKNSCYMYIAATSEDMTLFYTITIKYNNTLIQLHEGYPQTLTFDQETLFYYILNNQEVSIQWYSYGGSQANIIAYYGDLNNPQLQFENFDCITQCYSQFQSILVPVTEQYKILFIKVTPNNQHYQNDTYTLGVYEKVKLLTQSDPIIDFVQKGLIQYYRVILSQDVQSIVFNLNVFSGKDSATLYLSSGKDSRPTHIEHEFTQVERLGSFYIFQNQTQTNLLQAGDYIVGIHGIEDSDYQLSYNIDNSRYYYAFPGYPFDIHLKESISYYYAMQWSQDKPFKISLITIKGQIQVQIRLQFDDNIKSLNDTNTLFINEIVTKQQVFKIDNCKSQQCIYIVELIAIDNDAQCILEFSEYDYQVTLYDGLEWNEILNESESVDYLFYSSHSIQINMQMITGDLRLYIKEGYEFQHNDEADYVIRIQKDQQINYNKKTQHRQIIIRIESLIHDTYYKISIRDQYRNIYTLHLGQMMQTWIAENQTITFQYQSITSEQNKFITLQIQDVHQSIDNIFTDVKHTNIKPINYFNKYPKAISYHLYDVFGLYEISIKSLIGSYIRIIITNGELNALIDGIAQYHLTKQGQANYYEIFLQQKSKIFLEAFTCSGTIIIQGTRDQKNLARQIFEIQMMNSSQAHLQSILNLDMGTYYFMVKLVSSHTQDENKNKVSSYYIRQQTFDQGEIVPYTSFEYVRKNIEWFKLDDKLIIHVPNLQQIQKELPVMRIYFIIRMQQAIGEKSLACMFESNYVNNKTNLYGKYTQLVNQSDGNITTVTFTTKDEQTKFVSVVGKVQIMVGEDIEELTYPLPIVEMNYETQNSQEQIQQWVLLGLFLLILMFTGFFIYINVRRSVPHQNHNTLNIEMNYQTFH